jgi:hypothetical protein
MNKADLDKLREQVASSNYRGAGPDLRLARALIDAGKRDEALAVIDAAIAQDKADSAGELEIIGQVWGLSNLRAEILYPRPREIPSREWTWPSSAHGEITRHVCVRKGALRWTQHWKPPNHPSVNEQGFSSFVAHGPYLVAPAEVVRELARLLDAEGQPWFNAYFQKLRAAEEAAAENFARALGLQPRDHRVRASDYQFWAFDVGIPVEPTPAKTRDEFLEDLRGEDHQLQWDATAALQAFPGDPGVVRALATFATEQTDLRLASAAINSLKDLLHMTYDPRAPIFLVGRLLTEGAHPKGVVYGYLPRPPLARGVGAKWFHAYVEQRCAGATPPEYTDPGVRPRWSAALDELEGATTDEEAAKVLADYPELDA